MKARIPDIGETYTLKNQAGELIGVVWLDQRTIDSGGIFEEWAWILPDMLFISGRDNSLVNSIDHIKEATVYARLKIELNESYEFGKLKV